MARGLEIGHSTAPGKSEWESCNSLYGVFLVCWLLNNIFLLYPLTPPLQFECDNQHNTLYVHPQHHLLLWWFYCLLSCTHHEFTYNRNTSDLMWSINQLNNQNFWIFDWNKLRFEVKKHDDELFNICL